MGQVINVRLYASLALKRGQGGIFAFQGSDHEWSQHVCFQFAPFPLLPSNILSEHLISHFEVVLLAPFCFSFSDFVLACFHVFFY